MAQLASIMTVFGRHRHLIRILMLFCTRSCFRQPFLVSSLSTRFSWIESSKYVIPLIMNQILFDFRPDDGRSMKTFSLLQILRVGVLFIEWLDISIVKRYYDFGFDHYNLGWHKAGIVGLVNTLLNNSGPFAHENWTVPDLSIQSALELNKKLRTFDKTFYFRYVKRKHFAFDSCRFLSWSIFTLVCSLCCFQNHNRISYLIEEL